MKYVIVHLIRGEAKKFHEDITKKLTRKFGAYPLHDRVPPHITLKYDKKLDEKIIGKVYTYLDNFISSHNQSNYLLSGFGHFGKDVIYVDTIPSPEMSQDVLDLMSILHKVEGFTFNKFDTPKKFHASLARRSLKTFDYGQIWNYLKTMPKPNFKMKFDNVATLKKANGSDKWSIDRVWEIKEK